MCSSLAIECRRGQFTPRFIGFRHTWWSGNPTHERIEDIQDIERIQGHEVGLPMRLILCRHKSTLEDDQSREATETRSVYDGRFLIKSVPQPARTRVRMKTGRSPSAKFNDKYWKFDKFVDFIIEARQHRRTADYNFPYDQPYPVLGQATGFRIAS
jgi:hypothetical protein